MTKAQFLGSCWRIAQELPLDFIDIFIARHSFGNFLHITWIGDLDFQTHYRIFEKHGLTLSYEHAFAEVSDINNSTEKFETVLTF